MSGLSSVFNTQNWVKHTQFYDLCAALTSESKMQWSISPGLGAVCNLESKKTKHGRSRVLAMKRRANLSLFLDATQDVTGMNSKPVSMNCPWVGARACLPVSCKLE